MSFESLRDVFAEHAAGHPCSIAASATVAAAVAVMTRHNVDVLVAMDGPRFAGLLTAKDVLGRVVAEHRDVWFTRVGDICAPAAPLLPVSTPPEQALRWMDDRRCDHVAVQADTETPRVLSRRHLADWTIRVQQEQLDCAIGGARRLGYANRRG